MDKLKWSDLTRERNIIEARNSLVCLCDVESLVNLNFDSFARMNQCPRLHNNNFTQYHH